MKTIHTSIPRVITVDKNPGYPKAIHELKAAKKLFEIVKLRQIKYLNNIVEQDHPWLKRESGRDEIWDFLLRQGVLSGDMKL